MDNGEEAVPETAAEAGRSSSSGMAKSWRRARFPRISWTVWISFPTEQLPPCLQNREEGKMKITVP